MAEIPPMMMPEAPAPPKKNSNTLIWVLLIVGVAVLCILFMIVAAVLFPVFSQAKSAAQRTACLSNVKQLALGHLMYAADNDDRLSPADGWNQSIMPYVKNDLTFRCPLLAEQGGSGYAYNAAMQNKKTAQIADPQDKVLLFESQDAALGKSGGESEVMRPGRHRGARPTNSFGYLDGSARSVPDTERAGTWAP